MRAVRLHDPKDLRFEEVDLSRSPAPDHVRVRVAYAGICGSDLHNYKTGQWISRRPSTAGHEFSGVVDSVGHGVAGFDVGMKVVADSRDYCGICTSCKSRREHLCENLGFVGESIDGGFADFVDLPQKLVLKCDPMTGLDVVALAEPLAVALHALVKIRANDEPLFVVGCGPIGALAAIASRLTSNRALYVCDMNEERCAIVAQAADARPVSLNDFEALTKRPEQAVRQILDTTGSVSVIAKLLKSISGGTLGLVGIGSGSIDFDPVHAVEREITIVGCHAFTTELPLAIELLDKNSDVFRPLIEHRISLEAVPNEFEKITQGDARGIKTLIQIDQFTS